MAQDPLYWFCTAGEPRRRAVQLETVGQMFVLYDREWRTDPIYFDDLVFERSDGDASHFALTKNDSRVKGWQLTVRGPLPAQLAMLVPVKTLFPMIGVRSALMVGLLTLLLFQWGHLI